MELVVASHPATPVPLWIGFLLLIAGLALALLSKRILALGIARSQRQLEQQRLGRMLPFARYGGGVWLVIAVLALLTLGIMILSGHAALIPAPINPRTLP